MDTFFQVGAFPCPFYCRTRDKTDRHNTKGRAFLEALWRDYARFLDPDLRQRATMNMPAVFWELYVAHALHSAGISLQLQARTKQKKKGPDLFAVNPDVWIEAVYPEIGTGPDAMQHPTLGVADDTPVDTFILRLRSVFETKAALMKGYMEHGPARSGQATVIAISGCGLPTSIGEDLPVPRIVKALLGVGNLVLHLGLETRMIVDRSVEDRNGVTKQNGVVIRTDPFVDPAYAHISAVIYSPMNWVDHPEVPGPDFTVVYNENATVKVPRGWLRGAEEYWREGHQLRSAQSA